MISADLIARYFTINHQVLHMQVDGLSHEESLLRPPFRGNCLNWILGHIIISRNSALSLLGEEPVWNRQDVAHYDRDSDPLEPKNAFPLEKLMADLDTSQERLKAALERLSPEDLERAEGDRTLGERLSFSYWHEGYHTGQTELLRQLAGKDDKII